ncbi:hypothetical protein [Lactococcus lactis]|uniref:hypothetical protein n=1 Tax=Lactococcus lactis TaxID=1358 RepID=UPI0022E91A15|nr:hypothetical protein [Lactococcus lactis]
MIKVKVTPKFDRSCKLIYSLASRRIKKKYEQWTDNRNHIKTTHEDFYPANRSLIGNILECNRTKDNPYLITPKIVSVLVQELNFHDETEIFWGDDVGIYLEDLFTCLILDMKNSQEYTKNWSDFQLSNETQIKNFYHKFFVEKTKNLEKLTDDFIDFTYNSYHDFKIVESNGVCEVVEQDEQINKKNKSEFLTFTYLPEKLKTFAEEILLDFMRNICFENLLEENAKIEY